MSDAETDCQAQDLPHVVVLGAGMCGLYAARKLAAAGIRVTVIEQSDRPGGLAASMQREGNFFDLGVKHLHAHDKEIFDDIESIMGPKLLPVPLRALIKFGGGFRKYPLKFLDLLWGIPPWTLLWILTGLGIQQVKNRVAPRGKERGRCLGRTVWRSALPFLLPRFHTSLLGTAGS